MLPGKKYTPHDILEIAREHLWLLVLPLPIAILVTSTYARWLPDFYQSETTILVVPQRIPEEYVRATITSRIEDRVRSIQQEVKSRTRLENTIRKFDLYREELRVQNMEDVVVAMRDRISVNVADGNAFTLSYVGRDPVTVMEVTRYLATTFVDDSLLDRDKMAQGTNQFLDAQLSEARQRLIDHEKKLAAYRQLYSGQLPSQVDSNLQVIQNKQTQIQNLLEAIDRDHNERLAIQQRLADLQNPLGMSSVAAAAAIDAAPASAAARLVIAERDLARLEAQGLKPDFPDVSRLRATVSELRVAVQQEATAASKALPASPVDPTQAVRRRQVDDLTDQIAQLDRQIASRRADEARLRAEVQTFQAKIDSAPTRESEMTELTRDYGTLQGTYNALLQKRYDSGIAASLERRQVGEQFKILDPARIPERPISPNRPFINLIGLVAGLGVGAVIVLALEFRNSTFRTAEDITRQLGVQVLAVVPLLQSARERRLSAWWRGTTHATLAAAVCLSLLVLYRALRG